MHRSRREIIVLLLIAAQCVGCATAPTTPAGPIAPPAPPPVTTTSGSGQTVVVQPPAAQQCCPHPTIWQFLGLKGLCDAIKGLLGRIRSRLGMIFPGLEAKPALLEITDPANLESDNPAIKTAASVKGEEDGAEQKIKALRYLATIGCGGCYPDVQDAMLAALDDCTEEVRYEAVKALRETTGKPCAKCKTIACCSEKVRKRLQEVATAKDDKGCYKESSSRVRRLARLAMAGCGGAPPPETPESQSAPLEGPTEEGEPTVANEGDGEEQIATDQEPTKAKDPEKPAVETAEKKSDALGDKVTSKEPTPAKTPTPAQTVSQQKSSVVVMGPQQPACDCESGHAPTPTVTIYNSSPAPAKTGSAQAAAPAKPAPTSSPAAPKKTGPNIKAPGSATIYPPDATEKAKVTRTSAIVPETSAQGSAADGVIWAKVDGEPIFEHEILAHVEKQLARVAGNLDPAVHPDLRRSLCEREVQRAIDRKLLCQQARRALPSAEIQRVSFHDPALKGDPAFDAKAGSAVSEEEALAAGWLQRHVQVSEAISIDELKGRYQLFVLQGQGLEQMRGEQLTASFQRFGSKTEAYATIAHLRGQAMGLNPTPPEKLRLNLVELTKLDWKRRDQLPPGAVGEAMPRLPVGAVSPVLEDATGYHIVRVLERRNGDAPPLEAVAPQLRHEILASRRVTQQRVYLDELRKQARIWTIFDPPAPKGRILSVTPVGQE